jgi:hypothetical protein
MVATVQTVSVALGGLDRLRAGPLLAMNAHACCVIAVSVPSTALSAVLCTETAIMGRKRGCRPCSLGARLPASSDGVKTAKAVKGFARLQHDPQALGDPECHRWELRVPEYALRSLIAESDTPACT